MQGFKFVSARAIMNFRCYFTIPRIYPIWCLAISCILGIWWQSLEYNWYYTCLLVLIIFCLLVTYAHRCLALKTCYIILYVCIFLASCLSYRKNISSQQLFCQYVHNHIFDLKGIVTDVCPTGNFRLPYAIKLDLTWLECIDTKLASWQPSTTLCLYTKSVQGISISDIIKIKDVYLKIPKNKDFLHYLLKEEIALTATVQPDQIILINHTSWSINRSVKNYRQKLLDYFQHTMNKETYLSFGSIFLGNPVAKKKVESLKNQLKVWGLFHYIARAGLHLVIFISIWMFVLSFLPVAWLLRQLFMILLAGTYFILTWPSIPFNRAFFTFLLAKFFTIIGIKTYYIPSLSIIMIITLLVHPMYLFCLDFQLSFGITYALALFNEIRTQKY